MRGKARGGQRAVNWRRIAVRLHLWGGLVAGPVVVVLGCSGAVLVFRQEIEHLESAPPVVMGARPSAQSLDAVVAAARARYPAAVPRALHVPSEPGRPYRVELVVERLHVDVAVDPSTLQIVGGRAAERSLMIPARSLHAELHAGRAGAVVVGLAGLWLVVESVTGLWLLRPASRRRPPTVAAPVGTSRRLHRLVGVVSLAIDVVVAITGVVLAATSVWTLAEEGAPGRALSGLDTIAARVATALPGARISALVAHDAATIRVITTSGSLIVDREAGGVVRVPIERRRLSAQQWIRHLHGGGFAGWPSRIVYAFAGLALPVLAITGFLITVRRSGAP